MQIIPHITDEIKARIYSLDTGDLDVIITEIGGTVGDIESQPYLEAIRQVANEKGRENVLFIHVPLIVQIPGSDELKSKPTQHSVKELLSVGIQPDILVCRSDLPITQSIRYKISLFCNIEPDCVLQNVTASMSLRGPSSSCPVKGLTGVVCRKLGLHTVPDPDLTRMDGDGGHASNAPTKHASRSLLSANMPSCTTRISVLWKRLATPERKTTPIVTIKWVDSEEVTEDNVCAVLGGCSRHSRTWGFR